MTQTFKILKLICRENATIFNHDPRLIRLPLKGIVIPIVHSLLLIPRT
jgi:hypothetical protein